MTEGTGGVTSVISSESGDYPMCLAAWDFLGGGNPTCNDTTEWEQHQSPDNRVRGEMGSATGAASVTIDWDSLGGPSWTAIGFNIESSGVSVAIDESLSLSESLATGATTNLSASLRRWRRPSRWRLSRNPWRSPRALSLSSTRIPRGHLRALHSGHRLQGSGI
jgi:hypothetical protein